MPGPSDVVVLDLRTSLQQAKSLDEAWALFPGNDHTDARPARNESGWSFAANYDGQGTHALRADWAADPANNDQGIRIIDYFPTEMTEFWVQWKNRTGKHPADPDGNGMDNVYPLTSTNTSNACKRALFERPSSTVRVDFTLHRSSPEIAKVEVDEMNYAVYSNSDWTFDSTVGAAPFYYTVHIKAPSSGNNGVYQLWVDDKLIIDQSDVPMGTEAFDRWEFPATCTLLTIPGSDYFWDFLIWRPGP